MATAIARGKYLGIAPRKVRLVADMIRGKTVSEARDILTYTVKGSAPILGKLLASAVANAESRAAETRERVDTDEMVVKSIRVDGGPVTKRYRPVPRGRAVPIRKRSSHIELSITDD